MATYLSPGVYVEQVPSAIQPIAGVGTSTAAFIGVFLSPVVDEAIGTGDGTTTTFQVAKYPVDPSSLKVYQIVSNTPQEIEGATLSNDPAKGVANVTFSSAPGNGSQLQASYQPQTNLTSIIGERAGVGDGSKTSFNLANYPVQTDPSTYWVSASGATLTNSSSASSATVDFTTAPAKGSVITVNYLTPARWNQTTPGTFALCTNFTEFKQSFGDFSLDDGQHRLAHAVYGFFNNGGTRCYVVYVLDADDRDTSITNTLTALGAIDDVEIVAAPGLLDVAAQAAVLDHCENLANRFAILDGQPKPTLISSADIRQLDSTSALLRTSSFAAMYYPWITVYDPVSGGPLSVAPSGHIAGIYARVDAQRGVHKAPANEVIRGALDVQPRLSDADQGGLNPDGINALRMFSGGVTVWGARTLGGDANEEWKYLSVRRLMIFLAQSIKQGTQWVVFEPNDASLWAKITRNVTAFLTLVWRSGALFGATPQQAFYVKCDAETNPEEVRDAGQVVTQIGVAVTKPAEFVIFQISQWAGRGQ